MASTKEQETPENADIRSIFHLRISYNRDAYGHFHSIMDSGPDKKS
jgi:hypothetical protein